MTKRFPLQSLLFLSISAVMAGCTVELDDAGNSRPVIHLDGESTIELAANATYVEPGYQALDAEDGDLTPEVLSNSDLVNSQVPGEYEITYGVTDSGSLAALPAKRRVVVLAEADDNGNTGDTSGVNDEGPATDLTEDDVIEDSIVEDSGATVDVPSISSFQLLAFTPERDKVVVSEINDGTNLDLSLMPTNLLNIEAVSSDVNETGSVHFVLDGPLAMDRYENNAVYTLQTEPSQINTDNGELPVGDYSLTVTPYSARDMGGQKGVPHTVTFKVKDSRLEVSNVPKILAAEFVVVTEGDMNTFARIDEGYELDLSLVPETRINVLAISEDEAKTGSVHFSLNGPTAIDRYENNAVYTMADEQTALNLTQDGLRNGDYTLIITPYADSDMGGEAGIPLMVNFSVSGTAQVDDSSTPEVTPPVETVTLTVNSDSYSFNKGSDEQPGMTTAVSANDVFDAASAQFTVVSQPKHGTVTMFDLGFFEYTPAPDSAGTDSFTYQVSQNGKTDTATVSISTYDPQSKSGFTAITPSADSKLIYVSSSQGNDSNTCLEPSAPCKSIGAAFGKMRKGFPDHVYLKSGDSWRGESMKKLQPGRSVQEPAVISSYGDGARPVLEYRSGSELGIFYHGQISYTSIIGLEFSAYKLDLLNPEFTGNGADKLGFKMLGSNSGVLIEDNIFHHTEIVVQDLEEQRPSDFKIRRNIFTGAYTNTSSYSQSSRPSNMYISKIDGLLLEENTLDYGGWHPDVKGASANMYNHNVYLQYGSDAFRTVVRGNIFTRASSHGIQMRSGGTADNNFFGRNAIGLVLGFEGGKACAVNNVATEGHSMVKGVDPCAGQIAGNDHLCTAAVWGIHFSMKGATGWESHSNVVHSLSALDTQWSSMYKSRTLKGLKYDTGTPDIAPTNNHSWRWESSTEGNNENYADPSRTLGDYYVHLRQQNIITQDAKGTDNFDKFMSLAKARAAGTWPEALSADAINDYVRAGYGVKGDAKCQ